MQYIDPYASSNSDVAIAAGRTGTPQVHTKGGELARGSIVFSTLPLATETLTINGVYVEFTAGASDGTAAGTVGDPLLINIKASITLTIDEIVSVLNATANTDIDDATYSNVGGTDLLIVHDSYSTASNTTFTIAASVATPSGATLTGGQDVVPISDKSENIDVALTDTNDQHFSLADAPAFTRKTIVMSAKGTGNAVITPTNFTDGTTITLDTALDYVQLQFIASAWKVVGTGVATIA